MAQITLTSWRILSNYKTFGLAFAVQTEIARLRKMFKGMKKATAKQAALVTVRRTLSACIDNRSFFAPA